MRERHEKDDSLRMVCLDFTREAQEKKREDLHGLATLRSSPITDIRTQVLYEGVLATSGCL